MKVVLFALCASYSHTGLAIRCLRPALEREGFEVVCVEGNLRDRTSSLLHTLYSHKADVYGFSCYIWNIEEMLCIARDLHSLLPDSRIVFGGPEVSYDVERFTGSDFIDCIVCGEGESIFPKICRLISEGKKPEKVYVSEKSAVTDGVLYREEELIGQGKSILYYESSRGCPFSCAYCLSSARNGVTSKTAEVTLSELLDFEKLGDEFKIIKFIDRTFNFSISRANEIWRGLLDEKYTKKYHFEVCAALLDEESFEIFAMMPKGKIQLEVGLQSTNERTLSEVARHLDVERTLRNCERIKSMGNIHVHLDLIAGLPFEEIAEFRQSFDSAYHCCHMLQLGFLKLLHGTSLRSEAEKYGYKYLSSPPYTVLESSWISYDEMHRLEKISFLLERYHESGNFDKCLDYALDRVESPFDFYCGLSEHIDENDGREIQKISQADAFSLLYTYAASLLSPEETEAFERLMHEDFSRKEVRKMPKLKK